jgi:hypothetical protein
MTAAIRDQPMIMLATMMQYLINNKINNKCGDCSNQHYHWLLNKLLIDYPIGRFIGYKQYQHPYDKYIGYGAQ